MTQLLCRVLTCLCLLLVLPLKAQVVGSFPVRRYGTEQGLGSEVVSALVQDQAGRLWVGTEGGLCFFNGRRFTPFTGALPSQFVRNLFVDRDDSIWVATQGGLARVSQGRSQVFGVAEGIPQGSVESVARDAEGHLWVLTSQGVRVEATPTSFISPTPWPGQELPTHLFADPTLAGAWAITSRSIWHWDKTHWTRVDPPRFAPGEILMDVAVDGDRDLWVRTSSSLWRLPFEGHGAWIGTSMAGGYSHISTLSRDLEGWVWVDTAAGLWRVKGTRREQFGHAQDEARGGMVDQEGGLWLRTDKGIFRVLGQTRWRTYGPQDGIPQDTAWQMLRDHQGQLWVGMDSGLWVLKGTRFQRVAPGRFLGLNLAKDGTLWASGSPGGTVHLVNTRTQVVRPLRMEALPVARITAGLTLDAENRPWVANTEGGVVRGERRGQGWIWSPMPIDGAAPRGVQGIFPLPGSGVLMLHDGSASIWRDGSWQRVPDLLSELPTAAAIAPDGKVAIAYRNRPTLTLHHLQGSTLVRDAVLDLSVAWTQMTLYSVAFGAQGRIWVGTSKGLGFVDGTDARAFRILGTEDRIISSECDEGAILVEPGRVWIGGPSGLMSHDLLSQAPRQDLRPPLVLSAQAGSRELDLLDSALVLPRIHNELEVQFVVPNYQVQGALFYAAKLWGVDADWVHLDTPSVRYAGLQAGPHVLELRGLTQEGVLGPVTTIHFRVQPAWWERWWVRILGLFGLGGLIFILVKVRQAQLERRNRELMAEVARQTSAVVAASKAKSAFLANMSHELRTPLNAILLYSEIMQEDMLDPSMVGLRSDAGKIRSAGQHLLGLIDDILDMSKIEAGHLHIDLQEIEVLTFLHDLDTTIRPLVEKNGNRFELDFSGAPDRICSDPTRFRQILMNLLSNSAKFTTKGRVLLKAWSEGESFMVKVQDDGIGMTQEQQARVFEEFMQADESTTRKYGGTGLGLTLVKKLMDLLGGELTLHSMPGKGTTFILKIPRSGPPLNPPAEAQPGEPLPTT